MTNRVEVDVLACASCGGAVPLGDADEFPCPYCAAPVEVPEEHRALRDAEHQYNQHRGAAQTLLRRLGKPPSAVVRFLAGVHGGTVVWLVVLGTLVSAGLCATVFVLVARLSLAWFHVDLDDVALYRFDPNALMVIGQFAFLLAFLGSLVVLGAYTKRRGAGLRELQAGLAAEPPTRPGGPATCRRCGAPLSAPAGALAVTCPYCSSDNLLEIPERWIGAARKSARKLAGAVEEAARAFQDEARELRRSLIVRLIAVGIVSSTTLFVLVGLTNFARLESTTVTPYRRLGAYDFDWQKAVERPWLILDQNETRGCVGLSCAVTLSETACSDRRPLVVPAGACDADVCSMHWYVALRRGDAIELTASGLTEKTFVTLESHVRGAPFNTDAAAWGVSVPGQFAWLTQGRTARLTASHDGWFQVFLGIGAAVPGTPLDLCARLVRAEL